MTETHFENRNSLELQTRQGPSLLFLIGAFLWVLCLVAVVAGFYQWRGMVRTRQAESNISESAGDGDGRSPKRINLAIQKDGSFVPQEVTPENEANPWDAEGIEDFSFTNTSGQTLTKKDLIGKPFIISFVFTRCAGPCPNVTRQMRELQDRLKDYDFNLITLTVDPRMSRSKRYRTTENKTAPTLIGGRF